MADTSNDILIVEEIASVQKLKAQIQQMEGETDEAKCAVYIGSIIAHPLYLKFRNNLTRIMSEQVGIPEEVAGSYCSGMASSFIMKFLLEKTDTELLELVNRVVINANNPVDNKRIKHIKKMIKNAYQEMAKAQKTFLLLFGEFFKAITDYDDFIRKPEEE